VTLLAVCRLTHRESYFDIVMAAIVGPIIALAVAIALGSASARSELVQDAIMVFVEIQLIRDRYNMEGR